MKVKWQSDAPKMELKVPSEVKIDGYIPTEEDLTFTGDCSKLFYYGRFSWVLEHYTSLFSFSNIGNADSCFRYFELGTDLTNLIFYMSNKGYDNNLTGMFGYSDLPLLPHIVGRVDSCASIFQGCKMKLILDNFFDDFIFKSRYSVDCGSMFRDCRNLIKVPSLKAFKQLDSQTGTPYSYQSLYYYLFNGCSSLQEIRDLPIVYGISSVIKQNIFDSMVNYTEKLFSFTFEPNQTAHLSNQKIDFSRATGFKKAYPMTTYAKDSVYNHDSAVETINSLPDTSAFLAEVGGTNTITFYSDQGANTEGGAIGNLTAEEIAVAAAKGWTVAFSSVG